MDVRFRTVRFDPGYDIAEVDDFLDRCERALAAGDGSVTAETVQEARFTPTRFQNGYDMDEVDRYLDEVLAPRLAEGGAGPSGGARTAPAELPAPPSPTPEGGKGLHPAERRGGFLARLFGRR